MVPLIGETTPDLDTTKRKISQYYQQIKMNNLEHQIFMWTQLINYRVLNSLTASP